MKISIEADLHTHSIASGHAYSTIAELAKAAQQKGLKMIAITDHGPLMPGGPHDYYFGNLRVIPDSINGVKILTGVEANIKPEGDLDLTEQRLESLDFVAAGLHGDIFNKGSENLSPTEATVKAIQNPLVDMISHPANNFFPLDMEKVVRTAVKQNVVLEVNASSYDEARVGYRGDQKRFFELCKYIKKYKGLISINSDAHFAADVGNISCLLPLIEQTGITAENIVNTSIKKVEKFIKQRRQ
ncbi:MAG: phosphatase [Halothermotrichaceae bacterium]